MSLHADAPEKAAAPRDDSNSSPAATGANAPAPFPKPPAPAFTNLDRAQLATRRWMLAGLAAMAVAMLVSFTGMLHLLPRPAESLSVFVCGWAVFAMLAPRRAMKELEHDDGPAISLLAERAQAVVENDRRVTLADLVLERNDDVGRLSRALRDLAADARTQKQQTRLMNRRLGHHVQRETVRATASLHREAMTDPLTGLGNRRALQWHVEKIISRDGAQALVAIMVVDLDHFKVVNDTLGHGAGDRCLRFLAEVMKSCLRDRDVVIRLGGDEFLAVMPGATTEAARRIGQRLLTLFGQMPWSHALPRPTLSIGMAGGTARDLSEGGRLLERADSALYAAKRNGRATLAAFSELSDAA